MLQHLLADPLAAYAVLAVLFALLSAVVLVVARWAQLNRMVAGFSSELPELIRGHQTDATSTTLARVVSARVALPAGESGDDRVVLRERIDEPLADAGTRLFREGLGRWAYFIGENLTAIALVLTFALLAWVLISPVYEALRVSGTEQSLELSRALQEMGAKFIISACGVLGSLIFQWVSQGREQALRASLASAWAPVAASTVLLDVWEARVARTQQEAVVGLKQDLAQVRSTLGEELLRTRADLFTKLDKLESVEVSLQDIGTNVQASFSTMMKQHVADVIRDKLANVEASVRAVAEQLQAQFTAALQDEMSRIRTLLADLQKTIASQSASDLEKVVLQLRDAVSGGFHSQSQDMARQLASLAEILPRLEQQFSAVTSTLSDSARSWGEENQRSIAALTDRISTMLSSFEEARGSMHTSVDRLLAASGKAQLAVTEASQQQAATLSEQISGIRATAARDFQDFESRTQAFSQTMEKSQAELLQLTNAIRATSSDLLGALRTTSQAQADSREVLTRLVDGIKRMTENALTFDGMVKHRSELVDREEKLAGAQRAAVDNLAPVLQKTMTIYEEALKRQNALLMAEWQGLAKIVKDVVDRSSNGLVDSVDELQEALTKAVKDLGPRRSA